MASMQLMAMSIDGALGKLCENGSKEACITIVEQLPKERTTDQNAKEKIHYYTKACELGYVKACFKLAWLYHMGRHHHKNYKLSLKYYKITCDHNISSACHNLGTHFLEGMGTKVDYEKALKYYKKALKLRYYEDTLHMMGRAKKLKAKRDACVNMGLAWDYANNLCD